MSKFSDLVRKFIDQKGAIENKGGVVNVAGRNPSPDELIAGINSIETFKLEVTSQNGYCVITAERPSTTIGIYNSSDELIASQTTNAETGGIVTLTVAALGDYAVRATNSENEELWSKTISITGAGVYNCKPALALAAYDWADINLAAKHNYAKYMFKILDFKKLASFMGGTGALQTNAYIIGFDHDDKVGGGKAGITFMLKQTSAKYKHWNTNATNDNGISWLGSLIRKNCLKTGEDYYAFDKSVNASTSGTYYIYDNGTNSFVEQLLPDNFVTGTKYYTRETLTEDGSFINGLPEEVKNCIVQVKKKTWTGWGGSVLTEANARDDNTIIETNDWMFLMSDSEVFGTSNRTVEYSKYRLEGETYEAFKKYDESLFRWATSGNDYKWFRSPCCGGSSGNCFCGWNTYGCVGNNGANYTAYCPLCFCF